MAATGSTGWMSLIAEPANVSTSTAATNAAVGVQVAGTISTGVANYAYADSQARMAKADAAAERDAAAQQANLILRATQRQRAAARAATAGSGAKIDAFSLANEQEILQAGETDAAMAILGGKRKGRMLEIGAGYQKAAGANALAGSLFDASRQMSKWKGAKPEFYDGTTGDSSAWPK